MGVRGLAAGAAEGGAVGPTFAPKGLIKRIRSRVWIVKTVRCKAVAWLHRSSRFRDQLAHRDGEWLVCVQGLGFRVWGLGSSI